MSRDSERITFLIITTFMILYLGIQYDVLYIAELFRSDSFHEQHLQAGILLGITFNTFFILTLYTFFKVAFTSPGRPVFDKELIEEVKRREIEYKQNVNANVNQSTLSSQQQDDIEIPEYGVPPPVSNYGRPYSSSQYQLAPAPLIIKENNLAIQISEEQQINQQLYEVNELEDVHTSNPKRCLYCESFKVPRIHHCRICGFCIFRRDHHCVWMGNCIGIKNHKFFLLFLIYAALALFQIALPTLLDFLKIGINIMNSKKDIVSFIILSTSMIISGAFTISLLGLFFFQLFITCKNETTLEIQNCITSNQRVNYSRGRKYFNLAEIFGEKFSYRWFLPVSPNFNSTFKIYCEGYEVQIV
ncbi:hypothetical protein ABPG72_007919 [Tetrahymena utriculariae]